MRNWRQATDVDMDKRLRKAGTIVLRAEADVEEEEDEYEHTWVVDKLKKQAEADVAAIAKATVLQN